MSQKQVSIILSGEAGQGLETIESIIMELLGKCGFNAFLSKEFMSRVRGGNNTSEIRVSSEPVSAFSEQIDVLIALRSNGVDRLEDRLAQDTLIIGANTEIPEEYGQKSRKIINLDFKDSLSELGGAIYTNIIVAGIISGMFSCQQENAKKIISTKFQSKGNDIVEKNHKAFEIGLKQAEEIGFSAAIAGDDKVKSESVLSGTQAIGIGALAGGCNFVASYPMSPSTGVLVFLAQKSERHGVLVEQAEDEIAAINMMLGAWYAGARAMVTTSGGGYALMNEGLSLSGIIESPAVIHLAQRPGPATGVPTRTEQGDLNFAIYGGHGEFPRVVYAPGTNEDAIKLTARAFATADKYQIPVIILTDQFFLDSVSMTEKIDFSALISENNIIETSEDYHRYVLTDSGLSPRGIPGYGNGLVCLDSDEHSEDGRITEDFDMRIKMNDKRMKKMSDYGAVEPEIIGSKDYSTLVVGWGSTYGAICEALKIIDDDQLAFAYFRQVFPVPPKSKELLKQAKNIIVVENNATGQFAGQLQLATGIEIQKKILKYNGMPFSVEELVREISGGAS
ncbi:MAG: 2-oxoacid:acceptor oxidoreductase subunit alpha [Candidatus Rifleibacteriota bacterium]